MPELRWILLLLGLVVLAGIYVWDRRRKTSRKETLSGLPDSRVEPRLDGELPWESGASEGASAAILAEPEPPGTFEEQLEFEVDSAYEDAGNPAEQQDPAQQKILALHIRSSTGADFGGTELLEAFASENLVYGDYGAFHHLDETGKSLFTVVSMLEPGSFPVDEMEGFATRGLSAFMLVRPQGSVEALAHMIASARRLAGLLGGEVLDETGSTLTNQRATHMKEEIVEHLRQSRLSEGTGPFR
ncbi:MAG: cell division protein ZipA C-terminal FtsZ-binding domain-containing protein [Gammaproteobacteria bacterium]